MRSSVSSNQNIRVKTIIAVVSCLSEAFLFSESRSSKPAVAGPAMCLGMGCSPNTQPAGKAVQVTMPQIPCVQCSCDNFNVIQRKRVLRSWICAHAYVYSHGLDWEYSSAESVVYVLVSARLRCPVLVQILDSLFSCQVFILGSERASAPSLQGASFPHSKLWDFPQQLQKYILYRIVFPTFCKCQSMWQ